jgi:hypothetical protein
MNHYIKIGIVLVVVYFAYKMFFAKKSARAGASGVTKTAIANQETAGAWEL